MNEYSTMGGNRVSDMLANRLDWAEKVLPCVGYGAVSPSDRKKLLVVTLQTITVVKVLRFCLKPYIHPALAILECGLRDPEVKMGLAERIYIWPCLWFLRRAAKMHGDQPGVNDGLMCRWFWTHDPKYLQVLVNRSKLLNEIGISCYWMLKSIRQRDGALDAALNDLGIYL